MNSRRQVLAFGLATIAVAAAGSADNPRNEQLADTLEVYLRSPEKEIMSLAQEMPAGAYTFAPTKGEFRGVRSFEQQLLHVAAVNYDLGSALLGEKSPVIASGSGELEERKSSTIKLLRSSFEFLHRGLRTVNASNELEMVPVEGSHWSRIGVVIGSIAHINDHYGQCVVYARMNKIIPPASRQ